MKITLRTKIVAIASIPLLLAMILFTAVSVSSMIASGTSRVTKYRESLLEDVKERLKTRTELAVNAINKHYKEGDNDQSKESAGNLIRQMTYGKSGYFWINDFFPKMVMHPFSPHLEGKSLRDFKDPNGVHLFNEMVEVSKAHGEGFVPYMWPKPGVEEPQPKMSFVMAFKPWNWIIGTGVYIDDIDRMVVAEKAEIDREVQDMIIRSIVICVVLIVLIGFVAFIFVSRTITRRIYDLVNNLKSIEESADFSTRTEVEGSDEIAESQKAFNELMVSLQMSFSHLTDILGSIAEGDLSRQMTIESKGDLETLKISINDSIKMLQQIILDVKEASIQVNSGADELSRTSQSLAAGTSQQAASIEEITSSMGEVGAQTRTNTESATSARKISAQMMDIVEEGNQQMGLLTQSMAEINDTSADVNKIIKVIDEIAFQTNLLALNAAVEAARAGKYGKGFAVVAEEVRNLAGRSAEAAKNTTELIGTSVSKVEEGVKNSELTAGVLEKINTNAAKVNDLVSEIAAASIEQTGGIEEVNKGLHQINSVIQQNASISEEAASASEELSSIAQHLQEMMRKFTVA
jgi:methyl-accepting chemotaxis protein